MKDNYHHCCAMYLDAASKSQAVVISFAFNKIVINIYSFEDAKKLIQGYLDNNGCVIFGKTRAIHPLSAIKPITFEPFNCATLVKRLLGIKKTFIWTPYSLYKLLINKYNFKEVSIMGDDDPNKAFDEEQEDLTEQLRKQAAASNTNVEQQQIQSEQRAQGGGGFNGGSNTVG